MKVWRNAKSSTSLLTKSQSLIYGEVVKKTKVEVPI